MTATANQVSKLRRMVAELLPDIYSDVILIGYIETYPHLDEFGESPLDAFGLENVNWTPSYDLNAAAADIWEEKSAAVASKVNFSADGGNYSMSQQIEQYMKMCRYYRSRRLPTTARLVKTPKESNVEESWIGNLPEGD